MVCNSFEGQPKRIFTPSIVWPTTLRPHLLLVVDAGNRNTHNDGIDNDYHHTTTMTTTTMTANITTI